MLNRILPIFLLISSISSLIIALSVLAKTKTTKYQIVSSGDLHCLAVKPNSTLWAWGYNYFGQIGDGTTTDRSSPFNLSYKNKAMPWIPLLLLK